jgi:LL-diaminopimelate aminotransferase
VLPKPTATLSALPEYVFAQLDDLKAETRARGINFIDLGIGNPDSPIPDAIITALTEAAHDPSTHGYPPFHGLPRFLESATRFMHNRFGVQLDPEHNALALSGSKEGLAQVAMSYCGPGDVALMPDVYYPVHARSPLLNGADVYYLKTSAESGFLPDLDAVPAEILRRAKILILNYPNNPTGAVATREFFERAVEFAHKNNVVLVSDLAYSEIAYDDFVPPSVFEIDGALDVAVEFHSCSKSFNMAGMRLGFVAGNAEIIKTIAAYRTNIGYGTPTVIQHAGAYALDHYRELATPMRDKYRRRRDAAVQAFRDIGWSITPPKATLYIWLPVPAGYTEWEWTHTLLDKIRVVVTPGLAFGPGGTGYFRLSLVADEPVLTDAIHRFAEIPIEVDAK